MVNASGIADVTKIPPMPVLGTISVVPGFVVGFGGCMGSRGLLRRHQETRGGHGVARHAGDKPELAHALTQRVAV